MLFRFCLYGFLKNQQYYDPFLILAFRDKGLSFAAIGLLIGFREICINVMEIPTGAIADATGRRTAMILSHLSYLVAFGVFAMADDMRLLLPAMFAFSVGEAFRTGTHKAIIFDWLRREGRAGEKTRIYGLTRSWSKKGSAVAVIVGSALVFILKDYTLVFLLSMIPIAANIVNFLGYPKDLDGRPEGGHGSSGVLRILREGLRQSLTVPAVRGLLLQSMSFEGTFRVCKDYLQPVIKQAALAMPILLAYEDRQRTAVLVGGVYVILHLLGSTASKHADDLVRKAGSEERGSLWLWFVYLASFAVMLAGLLAGFAAPAIAAFVVLAVSENFWRPILIGLVGDRTGNATMATVLSVESQAKTLFSAIAAPLLGLAVDRCSGDTRFVPVALFGVAVCAVTLVLRATGVLVTGGEPPAGPAGA